MKTLYLYEDPAYRRFLPLTATRPIFNLLLGTETLLDRVLRQFPVADVQLVSRDNLADKLQMMRLTQPVSADESDAVFFLNGRVVWTSALARRIEQTYQAGQDCIFSYQNEIVAVYSTAKNINAILTSVSQALLTDTDLKNTLEQAVIQEVDDVLMLSELWDLICFNADVITSDCMELAWMGVTKGRLAPYVRIESDDAVFIDSGTVVEDFVLINAASGPVYIGKDVYIEAHSRLEGPLFIGAGSRVNGGTRIKSSSIGPGCKVGGEITNSVMIGYSNKGHEGFLGHSYLGEWVNLGAHTTTSNLKNTYGPVMLDTGTERRCSGQTFLGSIIADHVKVGIGTVLNTGTIIDVGANLVGTTLHPKYVPAFSWGEAGQYTRYELPKFLTVTEVVMARRGLKLTQADRDILTALYPTQ